MPDESDSVDPGPAPPAATGGRLVVVATPIGNLGDLSPRAAAALADADLIAAEDTRRTRRLLDHIGASTPMTSLHEHNEAARSAPICDRVEAGAVVAVVTDAGTPGVSDPGWVIVREATRRGLHVEVVPGPSAALVALVASGLAMDRFCVEGFLPRKGTARRRRLAALADEQRTSVLYVSPHRADADLADLAEALGADRPAAVARELTKRFEEVRRGPLGELAAHVAAEGLRGEVTVVVAGAPEPDEADVDAADLVDMVAARVAAGASTRDAVRAVADATGVAKREVYRLATDGPA